MELTGNGNPIHTVDDWFRFAPPMRGSYHWRDGHSAKELARAWCREGAPRVPAGVEDFLHRIPGFSPINPVRGYAEHRTSFDVLRGEPCNADLMLECDSLAGPIAVLIEAKSREPFGDYVHNVVSQAAQKFSDEIRTNQPVRLQFLYTALFSVRKDGAPTLGELRYQLLTASAGVLAHATRIGASAAILLVHEFRPENIRPSRYADNQRALRDFIHRIGGNPPLEQTEVHGPFRVPGNETISADIPLFVGKVRSACDAVVFHPPRRTT